MIRIGSCMCLTAICLFFSIGRIRMTHDDSSAVDQKTKCPVAVKKNLRVFPVYIPNESMDDDDEEYESIVISKSHPHRSTISQLRILRELKILIHLSSHPNVSEE